MLPASCTSPQTQVTKLIKERKKRVDASRTVPSTLMTVLHSNSVFCLQTKLWRLNHDSRVISSFLREVFFSYFQKTTLWLQQLLLTWRKRHYKNRAKIV
jgi:hypothetical protein